MDSLDPRISRLNRVDPQDPKKMLDQLITFEVFVQPKEGKPYRHEGVVHSSDEEMAFVFAKEQFSRRMTCNGIWVARTSNVFVSEYTDADESAYSHYSGAVDGAESYDVFHLLKRGKQHVEAGMVKADSIENAFIAASAKFGETLSYNFWIIKSSDMFRSDPEDRDIWDSLPEKKFRDAIAYRAGDKLKDFLESKKHE